MWPVSTAPAIHHSYPLPSARNPLPFDSRVALESIDELVELLFGEIYFLGGSIHVEQTSAHRDRDLIQVANLRENFLGHLAETDEPAFLGKGAPIAQNELRR